MNRDCPHCHSDSSLIRKHGHFVRNSDKKSLLRFRCLKCHKTFSQATSQQNYYQKLRKLHPRILELFCSGISQRRMALLLKISRTTVARKLILLAQTARLQNQQQLQRSPLIGQWQFDDLETIEHTKLKPLSVTMAVEQHTRLILGFRVSQMPAKGLLAKKSRKKYGHREDLR